MSRREIKTEGKDVAAAIIRGLNELGRRRDQVEVTVIQEAKSGFLGIGGRPAIVHIIEKKWDSEHSPVSGRMRDKSPYIDEKEPRSPKRRAGASSGRKEERKPGRAPRAASSPRRGEAKAAAAAEAEALKTPKENEPQKLPPQEIQDAVIPDNMLKPMAMAKESLCRILGHMNVKTENLNAWWDGRQQRIILTFDCDHPAIVIGKEGRTLESIQYLITLIVSRDFENPISVMADTQNYWRKLEDKVDEEISAAIKTLKRTRRPYKFRPMPAQVRRYVHRYFTEDSGMSTASEGEGRFRKVVLRFGPKGAAPAAGAERGERRDRDERSERDGREEGRGGENVAHSKADLTPIDWDNIPGLEKKDAACDVSAEPAVADDMPNSADSDDKSGAVSADNAGESCVLTAETASCEDIAETAPAAAPEQPEQPEPAVESAREPAVQPDVPAHTNTGSGVAGKPQE
ncbi:MAG: Jag N-terminal domain-containing protein [Elusimicrobiota bacterium]|jgi:spoIIIJ-associated protein|nr:Jag N-terminal domain-containing protein [Elusimicrobiota bacterium]